MRTYNQCFIAAGLLIAVISIANGAEVLANSGYPCLGGNAQRTYKIDRNFHCPAQTNGRSTVLNVAWIWPPDTFDFDFVSTEITTDAEDHIYVQGKNATANIIYRVHFENGTLSTTDSGYIPTGDPPASLTHVANGFMYMASATWSEYVEESSMSAFVTASHTVAATKPSSYVPFAKYMLRSNVGAVAVNDYALTYWDSNVHLFDTNAPNYQEGRPIEVVIGSNATSEFCIVVTDRSPFPEYPIHSDSTPPLVATGGTSPPVRAWFEDGLFYVLGTQSLLVVDWSNSSNNIDYSLNGGIDGLSKDGRKF